MEPTQQPPVRPTGPMDVPPPPTPPEQQGEDLNLWQYFIRSITTKYATFTGRARRKEFWGTYLFIFILMLILSLLIGKTMSDIFAQDPDQMKYIANHPDDLGYIFSLMGGNVIVWIYAIVVVALIIPTWALTMRRFHDVGLPAWVFWLITALSLVNGIIGQLALSDPTMFPEVIVQLINILSILGSLFILVVAFIPGKVGPNKYGPDPKPADNPWGRQL